MDTIFGCVDRTGAPVATDMLQAMLSQLSDRPDGGIRQWSDSGVGLGCYSRSVVSESVRPPPLNRNGLVVTADARIDNADDLATTLGVPKGEGISNETLLIAAYSRWGPECVNHLVGDFAFSIWDAPKRELFCARDPFGIRPLYYYLTEKTFAFASNIETLFGIDDIPHALDEWQIAEILSSNFVDQEATVFKAVRRLPAAHTLRIKFDSFQLDRYWDPAEVPEVHLATDADYARSFRRLLTEAVDVRFSTEKKTGIQLSGGLDSSSIAGVSNALRGSRPDASLRIPTISAVYPELPSSDETPYIESVIQHGDFDPTFVHPTQYSPLAQRFAAQHGLAEPLYWPTWSMEYAIFNKASQLGMTVLLSGHGGDHLLAPQPSGYYADLFRTGSWATLQGQIHDRAANSRENAWGILWRDAIKVLLVSAAPPTMLTSYRNMRGAKDRMAVELNPELERRLSFKQRIQERQALDERKQSTARGAHAVQTDHAPTHYGLERLNLVTSHLNVDLRHPFWHRPLVEFCLGIPRRQLFAGTSTRSLQRHALDDLLPPLVRERQSKASFNSLLCHSLWAFEREALSAMVANPESVAEWINVSMLRRAFERYSSSPMTAFREARFLLAALTLSQWRKGR